MKLLVAIGLLISTTSFSQAISDTIKLHFLYGSVPAKGYKKTEPKLFGAKKGGHVNIEANGRILDFLPGNCPILPENRKPTGGFRINHAIYWDTSNTKWITINIPVTQQQMTQLEKIFDEYSQCTPYDYAVFGMRCAAASYDVLSEIGLVKKRSDRSNIVANFYPKLLRKRMIKWAIENDFPISYHQGRTSRIWESDEGIF